MSGRSRPSCSEADPRRRFAPSNPPGSLPLSLLVLGNRADHPHDPVAAHDLAFHADSLDRSPDFHDLSVFCGGGAPLPLVVPRPHSFPPIDRPPRPPVRGNPPQRLCP